MERFIRAGLTVAAGLLFVAPPLVEPAQADASTRPAQTRTARVSKTAPTGSTGVECSFRHAGEKRHYYVHLPPQYDGYTRLPVVIMLHGGGGNRNFSERMTGFSEKANEEGFIAVYPDGTGRLKRNILTWNAIDCCGFAKAKRIDDVGFLSEMIDRIVKEFHGDPHRVYVTGFSNGAMMAYVAAVELSGKIAAAASIGGSMSGKERRPDRPVPMLIIHGTADRHVPFHGGTGKLAKWGFPVNKESVPYAVQFWVDAAGCATEPVMDKLAETVTRFHYPGGRESAEVELYVLEGAKHQWPGGRRAWIRADKPFLDLSATDTCWDFFSRHRRDIISESQTARRQSQTGLQQEEAVINN